MDKIEKEIEDFDEKIARQQVPERNYGTAEKFVFELLKNPVKMWDKGGYQGKRLVAKMVFLKNPVFDRKNGYGTAEITSGIKLFDILGDYKSHDVEAGRLNSRPKTS